MNAVLKIFIWLGFTLNSIAQNTIDINFSTSSKIKKVVFKAYPNPTTGLIYLETENSNNQVYHYSLYDTRGRQVLNGELVFRKNTINIEKEHSGIYFLNINNAKFRSIKTFKIFKE